MVDDQDYWSKLNEIHTDVQVTKVKVEYIEESVNELKVKTDDQQEQINALGSFQSKVKGAWAIMGGVVTGTVGWLASHLWKGNGGA